MDATSQSLSGGFPDAVYNSQAVFRVLMDCMARPGTTGMIDPEVTPPAPLGAAAGALLLTLCDHDTPIWLTPGLAKSELPAWISFHSGAPLTREKTEARFAVAETRVMVPSFSHFALGSQDYPDRSTTIVIEVEALEGGPVLQLTGPGIRDEARIAPKGLPEMFLRQWTDNRALFPRGVDVILTLGRQILALPRTCKITELEG
ncbi:phosphonate C-P lyase system protein PhnH [Peteryoungia desertarenae]|uniref:Phosphonate C-P lyase system protein PhnH n=1 Tax=Peteryoungia desertarenae TaxID=1813451 RepID=A0ABX6QKF1_9HYPH|nr:phosphonate C-P lyase system protein PhnH [Peteryoungia desertarenae]QLF69041.1 phosphonate C-P lyase system protein PhnH [Peteryoungia desertarenae]